MDLLADYPVVVQMPVAWGDMDAFGHLNNTVYFRYFESARIAYFERLGFLEPRTPAGVGPILHSTSCRFRLPLEYPDQVSIGARVCELGDDRFLMRYAVVSHRQQRLAAEGDGLIVSYDYRIAAKAPLPETIRSAIEELERKA